MGDETGKKSPPEEATGIRRRGLLRFGTLVTAFTGASAISALGANSVQAAPGDKNPPMDYVPTAEKGAPSGVATLDVESKIPPTQLPDLSAEYVTQGQTFMDLRQQPGVVGDGIADDSQAMQTAFNSAAALGVRVFARGTFKISATIQIVSTADLTDAIFNYSGAGVAVRVGVQSGYICRQEIKLPHVVNTNRTALGWEQVAGSVGVEINNVYSASVHVPQIKDFETGLRISGTGNGTSYVNVHLGHLYSNKRNLQFTADSGGWANQNNIFGGRMSHDSREGRVVAGTRHVLMDPTASKINNNNFFGTSLESPNVVEYHLDCAGNDNYFWGCRWENTGTGARIMWREKSIGNLIDNGFGAHTIVETKEPGTANSIRTRGNNRIVGYGAAAASSILTIENSFSSNSPAIRIMNAGAESTGIDQITGWAVDVSAAKMRGKRNTDPFERCIVDFQNGRLYVGAGTAPSTRYFGNVGTHMGFDGSDVCFATDNTYDLGPATYRPRYIRAGTALVTGAAGTTSRPSAVTAKAGAMFYDTTLAKPIWSDGTVWRDAFGSAV